MVGLIDIPNEIIEHILTFVSDINHSTIFNVALANKHLSQVVRPLRVRHWSDDGYYGYHNGGSPCLPISRLALELLRRPELRSRVKSLNFTFFQSPTDLDPGRVQLSPENLELLAVAADEILPDFARTSKLCENILGGWDDALAVLVITWATNLTSLGISVPFFEPSPRIDTDQEADDEVLILRYAKQLAVQFNDRGYKSSTPLPLAKLHHLEFRHWDTENNVDVRYLTPFLYLPKLKSLKTYRTGDERYDEPDERIKKRLENTFMMPFPAGTSSIEMMMCEESTSTSDGLSSLMRACRGLRVFHLDFAEDLIDNTRSCKQLARDLLHHASTMEELILPLDDMCDLTLREEPSDDGISLEESYKHLKKLKRLTVPMLDLFYESQGGNGLNGKIITSLVPESVEYLKLMNTSICCNWKSQKDQAQQCAAGMVTLLEETGPDGRLCKLRTLDLSFGMLNDPDMKDIVKAKSLAEANGVMLILQPFPPHRHEIIHGAWTF
ncbi:uncharacterized protein FTOL_05692 [Fusarium torulosum]|uniref:F-box domain-containing protein n=1 Tax=Fusarium torulosum TaxID=33205 RepID=A0AAE8SHF9_9HYPO|nr:uncharacterized protein FTOL_05692 [Fusarium torulosum]